MLTVVIVVKLSRDVKSIWGRAIELKKMGTHAYVCSNNRKSSAIKFGGKKIPLSYTLVYTSTYVCVIEGN